MSTFEQMKRDAKSISNWGRDIGRTSFGSSLKQGFLENFGWNYKGTVNEGFLGLNATPFGKNFAKNGFSSAIKSLPGMIKSAGVGGSLKAVGGTLLKGFGLGFTAFSAYEGYKEDGLRGAVTGGALATAQGMVWTTGTRMLGLSMTNPILVGVGAVAAGGYGAYRYMDASARKLRSSRGLEMGAPVVDTFGTLSTMRQRSLSALQNSHINGRLALGNEAQLLHQPMLR